MVPGYLRGIVALLLAGVLLVPSATAAATRSATLDVAINVVPGGACTKTAEVTWTGYPVYSMGFWMYVNGSDTPVFNGYVRANGTKGATTSGTVIDTSPLNASSGWSIILAVELRARNGTLVEVPAAPMVVPDGCVFPLIP
jgi:hypothetical protein